jgi:hypothetical protein
VSDQKLGHATSALYRYIPTGMHGPTAIFWTKLTPFSHQRIHVDYPNNSIVHPTPPNAPDAVACLLYLDGVEVPPP